LSRWSLVGFRRLGACVTGVSCFLIAAMSVASGRAGQGPGGAPAAAGGAGGVLEVTGREPDDLAAGNGEPGVQVRVRLCQVRPMSGSSVRAVPLAAVIPSQGPGRGRAAWGGSASGAAVRRGQSTGRPRRAAAAGQTDRRPRAWPLAGQRSCGPAPGCGQAADLPVAQAVVHQGEEPAGGGDLGDVAGFLPAPGDDRVLGRADHRVAGHALDRLDERPGAP